jgi:hypothetical protein
LTFTGDWPAYADDSGAGVDGTIVNKSLLDSIKTAISNQVVSGTNPTVFANAVIDEVVTARGNKANLNARIGSVIDVNGALIQTASLAPVLGRINLTPNAEFLMWSAGDVAAPDLWTILGGAAVQRCGIGLADTKQKVGDYCVRVTASGAGVGGIQFSPSLGVSSRVLEILRGQPFSFGMWVWSATANAVRIYVIDGLTPTAFSSYHTGGGTWEWLSVAHPGIDAAAGFVNVGTESLATVVAYFSGGTSYVSSQSPTTYQPPPVTLDHVTVQIPGAAAVTLERMLLPVARPSIVRRIRAACATAPTGANLILDAKKARGGTSLYTAGNRPTIAAGAFTQAAGVIPDSATYSARCFAAGDLLSIDIAQIGSGVAGSDIALTIEMLTYPRVLEARLPASA